MSSRATPPVGSPSGSMAVPSAPGPVTAYQDNQSAHVERTRRHSRALRRGGVSERTDRGATPHRRRRTLLRRRRRLRSRNRHRQRRRHTGGSRLCPVGGRAGSDWHTRCLRRRARRQHGGGEGRRGSESGRGGRFELEDIRGKLAANQAAPAIVALNSFIEQNPAHRLTPDTYMLLGQAYQILEPYRRSHHDLRLTRREVQQESRAPEALFRQGQRVLLSREAEREPAARRLLTRVAEEYPASEWAARALISGRRSRNACATASPTS